MAYKRMKSAKLDDRLSEIEIDLRHSRGIPKLITCPGGIAEGWDSRDATDLA